MHEDQTAETEAAPVDPAPPLVCLDTETTGLGTAAGTVPFLVGVGAWEGDRFRVRQLLMPDHPSERALLDLLRDLLPAGATLVTYNGRTFDWPLLVTRYRMHGQAAPRYGQHLDLLIVEIGGAVGEIKIERQLLA